MFTPMLVNLSEYLYELYYFYQQVKTPQILTIEFCFVTKFVNFSLRTGHIKLYLLKYSS